MEEAFTIPMSVVFLPMALPLFGLFSVFLSKTSEAKLHKPIF